MSKKLFRKKEKRNNTNYETLLTTLLSIIFIIFGILLTIISVFPFKNPPVFWKVWAKQTVSIIGGTLMSAGSVSILLEVGSIKTFISQSLQGFFNAELNFATLSNDVLDKFSLKIAAQRAKQYRTDAFNELLYDECEKKILENCTEKFIKKNNSKTFLTINEAAGTIHKDATFDYEYCNAKHIEEIVFSIRILADDSNINKIANNIIKSISINGEKLSKQEIRKNITKQNIQAKQDTEYDYDIIFKRKIETNGGSYSFKLTLSYDIPLKDLTQVYKITCPCKSLHHVFYLKDSPGWRLNTKAYTAFFCNEDDAQANFNITQDVGDNVKIEFNDWCLPGAGYIVTPTKII